MSTGTDELEQDEDREDYAPDGVHDRTDQERWAGVEVRGYVEPDLEILPRSKGGDGRTITGILVPFGRAQRIHEGLVEQFRTGAADHQLARPAMMKFAREHLKLGGTLIGRAHELRNDASGLWGALRASKTTAGDEAVTLVEDGALDELSIGFRAVRSRRLPDGTVERVRVDVLETALVLQGAYGKGARVTGLRSASGAQSHAQGMSVALARAQAAALTITPATAAALRDLIR